MSRLSVEKLDRFSAVRRGRIAILARFCTPTEGVNGIKGVFFEGQLFAMETEVSYGPRF